MSTVKAQEIVESQQQRRVELHTGLDENARANVVAKLSKVLADHYLLMLKTHNYHWNVRGPLFKSLHDLTEEQYDDLFEAIDELAERIRALGHDAPGTFSEYIELSEIEEAKKGIADLEMVADLVGSHENLIGNMRTTLEEAEKVGDEVTVDMMVNRLSVHEKYAWMLRSFIEK